MDRMDDSCHHMEGVSGLGCSCESDLTRRAPEVRTYANAAENALNLIAKACGFAREWDYPLQVVRDVEDRMRELAELRAAPPTPPRAPVDEAAVRADERRATEQDIAAAMREDIEDLLRNATPERVRASRSVLDWRRTIEQSDYPRTPAATPEGPEEPTDDTYR